MDSSEVTEYLNEWEPIQSQEWETVVAWDNHHNPQNDGGPLVFPPNSHEGLQIPPPPETQTLSQQNAEVDENEISPNDSESDGKFMRARFENLRSGIVWIASRIRYYAVCGRGLWPFSAAAAAAAAVVFYWRVRRRRCWLREERDNRLDLLVKKKDQRINQLLLQIAQMNEVLLARRKVAVLRIG